MITQSSEVPDRDEERPAGATTNDRTTCAPLPYGPQRHAEMSGQVKTEQTIRSALRRLLYSLDLAPPLDVELLLARLADARSRQITVQSHSIPTAGAFGALIRMKRHDLILLQPIRPTFHERDQGHAVIATSQPCCAGRTMR